MEQITFVAQNVDKTAYKLNIIFGHMVFEKIISNDDFSSNICTLDMIEKLITCGLNPNSPPVCPELISVCKINNNMIDEVLEIDLELKYHRKPLKPIVENHKFKLHKVEQNTETTFEVLLHNMEKAVNIPHVRPYTKNIFIQIENNLIKYTKTNGEELILYHKGSELTIYKDFLNIILEKDNEVKDFFENRRNSQENIDKMLVDSINEYYDGKEIYQMILDYFHKTYYINFCKIMKSGSLMMLNVSLEKEPCSRVLEFVEYLEDYEFHEQCNYRIIDEFIIERKIYEEKIVLYYNYNQNKLLYYNFEINDMPIPYGQDIKFLDKNDDIIVLCQSGANSFSKHPNTKVELKNRVYMTFDGSICEIGINGKNMSGTYGMMKFPLYTPRSILKEKVKSLFLVEQY